MNAETRPLMANDWLSWVFDVQGQPVVVTSSYVANGKMFVAALMTEHCTVPLASVVRSLNDPPVRLVISVGGGNCFTFDENIHDLTRFDHAHALLALHEAQWKRICRPEEYSARLPVAKGTVDDQGQYADAATR